MDDAGAARSRYESDAAKINALQKRLDQRDAVIRDLLRRVERLEREEASRGAPVPTPVSAKAETTAQARKAPALPPAASPQPAAPPPAAQNTSQSAAQGAQEQEQPGPGQFTVDKEAAQHALERALVQTGAALLEPFKLEFVPSLTYQFHQNSQPAQIALATNGAVLITDNVTRQTQIEANGLLRIGLPWDSQAEIGVPFDYKRLSVASTVVGASLSEQSKDVQGLGDPTFTLIKQILRESDERPGLFVSGTWNSDFGQTKNGIPLGTGFNELAVGLTAVKRQDPLVFTTGFTYQATLKHNGITPGDQYIPAVGMLLALSPETSLRFAQQISFVRKTSFNNKAVAGSEQTSGLFTFGLLSILGRGLVMNFNATVGETHDAPDLVIQLAFPIRLN